MIHAGYYDQPGIERLRAAVRSFGDCSEAFNMRYSVSELLLIHAAWMLSDWDFSPDKWTDRQVKEALHGMAPRWDADEKPVYK